MSNRFVRKAAERMEKRAIKKGIDLNSKEFEDFCTEAAYKMGPAKHIDGKRMMYGMTLNGIEYDMDSFKKKK